MTTAEVAPRTHARIGGASRDLIVGLAIVALALVAVVAASVAPEIEDPWAEALATVQVAGATLAFVVVLGTVGAAASMVVPAALRASLGLGPVLGLGAMALAVLGLLEHAITARVLVAPSAALVVAVVVLAVAAVRAVVREGTPRAWRGVVVRSRALLTSLDVVAVGLVAVVMVPVARLGLTAWTVGIQDWHRYVGSVLTWVEGGEAFLAEHPGDFGTSMVARAGFEKPAVTAVLVALTRITGLHPATVLTPFLGVMLLVLTLSAIATVRVAFATSDRVALLLGAAPALSVAVTLPLAQAQPGGIAAVALLSAAVAVIALLPKASTSSDAVRVGALAGLVLGVAVMSNATLALSSLPIVAAVGVWLALRWAVPRRIVLVGLAVGVVAALAVVVPQARRALRSFRGQTDGTAGVPFPLLTPAGGVGLEPFGGTPEAFAVTAWAVVIAVVLVWALVRRRSVDARGVAAVLALSSVIGGGLAIAYGAASYSTGKWLGVVLPIVVPVVLAACLHAVRDAIAPVRVRAALVLPAFGGGLVLVAMASSSPFSLVSTVVPASTMALATSQTLADEPVVNVDMEGGHAGGIVPMVVPSDVVVPMDRTYALPSAPIGDVFLVDAATVDERAWTTLEEVAPGMYLATLDLDVDPTGALDLLNDPDARDHLFGGWASTAAGETLIDASARTDGIVVLDGVAPGSTVVVQGYTEGDATVVVAIGDEQVEATPVDGKLELDALVGADDLVDGRLTIAISVHTHDPEPGMAVTRIDLVQLLGAR